MKHVSRFWAVAIALAFVTGAAPAFAEVQNIRIGGDLTVRGFYRDSLRFDEDRSNGAGGATGNTLNDSSVDQFFQTALGLNISADLTDNVSVDTRLINQRIWGSHQDDADIKLGGTATNLHGNFDSSTVSVAQAYVTLKELFYSPLTVKVGRQNLWWGRGMVLGHRLLLGDGDAAQTLAADEFTEDKGFDAVRATLDFDPVAVDVVYSKVDESAINSGDDVDLYGANVGYHFTDYNAETELYYLAKRNRDLDPLVAGAGPFGNAALINTIGLRGSMEPAPNLTTFAEVAYQWGKRDNSANVAGVDVDGESARGNPHQAWMANVGADYVWADADWTPRAGLEWRAYSGGDGSDSAIGGWDAMFRGNFGTLIREFQTVRLYLPSQSSNTTFNALTNSFTNQHEFQVRAGAKPLEDLDASTALTLFWADKGIHPTDGANEEHYLGTEWDTQFLYDYTEDVQLGLVYGVLFPGDVFRTPGDNTAQELVTTVKVSF